MSYFRNGRLFCQNNNRIISMASRSILSALKPSNKSFIRGYCEHGSRLSNAEVRKKRNELFNQEKARQQAHITRIEKIMVQHKGTPETCTLAMNKKLSTPYNCAMHIAELLQERSVLALVNDKPWDMHRPLEEDCTLEFVHFKAEKHRALCNDAFWRSCSFLLGHALEVAFKPENYVELCSFPKPDVPSGSFVHDAALNVGDWQPTQTELRMLSRVIGMLAHDDLRFERLDVDASLALKMFEDNRFKTAQIPAIAESSRSNNDITIYRMGEHIDISRGPMIGNTGIISRFSITAIHDIESPDFGKLQRVQGIAMPKELHTHFYSYEFLEKRGTRLNSALIPTLSSSYKKLTEASEAVA